MLELIFKNENIKVAGTYDKSVISLINEVCSYRVPTAEWSDKYQTGVWDGKISLLNKRAGTFPSGILSFVTDKLDEKKIPYTIKDERKLPIIKKNAQVNLGSHSFRDYQQKAINEIKQKQRGVLAMCTGAGKTKTSCGIISELSAYPVIFIVPGVALLKQTIEEFKQSLQPLSDDFGIGEVGGGVCNIFPEGVNVCTYQTILTAFDQKYSEGKKKVVDLEEDKTSMPSLQEQLKILKVDYENSPQSKLKLIQKKIKAVEKSIKDKQEFINKKAEIRELVNKCQLLFIDETHIAAVIIEAISMKCVNAYYKCGLTATPQRSDNQDLRMFGATGPVINRVPASELIQKGFLVRPYIYCIDMDFIDKTSITYQETYNNAIVLNEHKNKLIKTLAESMKVKGVPTLIFVERLPHGRLFEELIEDCVFVPGGDGSDDKAITDKEINYRKSQLNRLENNEIIMVVTQWANQGIDAPKIGCLIFAGSVSNESTVIQQVGRGLRKADGKNCCYVFDFKHKEKSLRNHFNSRVRAYKTEPEFYIKTLKYNMEKGTYV